MGFDDRLCRTDHDHRMYALSQAPSRHVPINVRFTLKSGPQVFMSTRPSPSSVGQKRSPSIPQGPKLVGLRKSVTPSPHVVSRFERKGSAVGAWRLSYLIRLPHKKEAPTFGESRPKFASVTADHDKGDERPRSVRRSTDLIAVWLFAK